MKNQRAPFAPITPDIDDDKLERLAAGKGVGALVKPVANAAGEGTPPPAASIPLEAPLCRDLKSLSADVPTYVWTALKIRAAERQTSLRHVLLTALRKDGIAILDEDMIEDGRRLR